MFNLCGKSDKNVFPLYSEGKSNIDILKLITVNFPSKSGIGKVFRFFGVDLFFEHCLITRGLFVLYERGLFSDVYGKTRCFTIDISAITIV
jgi:hypothetical protein